MDATFHHLKRGIPHPHAPENLLPQCVVCHDRETRRLASVSFQGLGAAEELGYMVRRSGYCNASLIAVESSN